MEFNPIEIEYDPSEIPVKTVFVSPTPKFIPPHVGGDRDFGGHGPNIWAWASISIKNEREIWTRIGMHARETKRDWTEARGEREYRIYRNDKRITGIVSDDRSNTFYRDVDHEDDRINVGAGDLVKSFIITGDTRGNEAGTRTGVVVEFNPITFMEE